MFRKISSAFSSLASPSTRPPKPNSLYSRNSTPLFTHAESSQDEPKIGVSTARLRNFLQTDCKSGDVTADEAFGFFHRMVQMDPRFPLYSFNLLLKGLAKNDRHHDVLLLFGKMNSVGLTPNFTTLNTLLTSSCNANRVCDAFVVMGRILRKGYSPTIVTFNSLIERLCTWGRVDDAVQLYLTLQKFGCRPDAITGRTLYLGLRLHGLGNTSNALKFDEEEEVVSYIIGSLCEQGKEDMAMKLFLEIEEGGFSPDVGVYNSLMNGLCYVGKWYNAQRLLMEMADRGIHFDGKTFHVLINVLCRARCLAEVKWVLHTMMEYGIDLKSEPVNVHDVLKDVF